MNNEERELWRAVYAAAVSCGENHTFCVTRADRAVDAYRERTSGRQQELLED